jgi:hypothetical protein
MDMVRYTSSAMDIRSLVEDDEVPKPEERGKPVLRLGVLAYFEPGISLVQHPPPEPQHPHPQPQQLISRFTSVTKLPK